MSVTKYNQTYKVLKGTSLTSPKGLIMLMPLPAVFLESSMSKAAATAAPEQTFVFSSLLIKKSITQGSIQNTVCDKCCVTVLSGTISFTALSYVYIPACGLGLAKSFCKVCLFIDHTPNPVRMLP